MFGLFYSNEDDDQRRIALAFKEPEDVNVCIWRYMDFTKLVSLLEAQSLFFSRLDKLGDPFEGSSTKNNIDARADIQFLAGFKNEEDTSISSKISPAIFKSRQRFMVNCWHKNPGESAAMWKLYAKSNEAIAIQSTYFKLRQCLDQKIPIGEVKYINYGTDMISDEGNLFNVVLHKRESFSHEHEIRAVTWVARDTLTDGVGIKVELDKLIDQIFVAPTSPEWFKDLVGKVLNRYGVGRVPQKSALDDEALF